MAEEKDEETCICRNIRIADAICFYHGEDLKPFMAWHKDCPVHRFITSVDVKEFDGTIDPNLRRK